MYGRPGQPAELRDLGLGEAVRRESQDFHPLLNLRTRMVKAVAVDPFEFGRRQVEPSHGILPRGDSRWQRLREAARDGKLSSNREWYNPGHFPVWLRLGRRYSIILALKPTVEIRPQRLPRSPRSGFAGGSQV